MKNTTPNFHTTTASYSSSTPLRKRLTALTVALGLTFQTLPALAASGDVYYVHSDHLDTPRQLTNQQNQPVWQNTPLSEPFGTSAPDEDPGSTGTPFTFNLRFPGQYYDQETGTHYNYYRDHYFPGLGRYGQSDPIGLYGGINTYAYVSGNPLLWSDPRGLFCGSGFRGAYIPNSPRGFPFGNCCLAHDNCYDDCKAAPPKDECDKAFHECMQKVCENYQGKKRESCLSWAETYFNVVVDFGEDPFNEARGLPTVPNTKLFGIETSDY
ncbi:MAG: hypothetical protein LBL72_06695 [Candidatus Accumulibacter sp.]|jgi:RHS repeat-associated protein|nr:hypothetical protein [Accumulibacter sp.]